MPHTAANASCDPHGIPAGKQLQLPSSLRPRLFVVVDTEEEFDWTAPFARCNTSVGAMKHVDRAQSIFDRFLIRPTYVIDYPVASQPEGYSFLQEIAADGRCDIGAHLHPWVNPPFTEPMTRRNSFTSNLGRELQRAKLKVLTEMITEHFGRRPRVFKAGRYGFDATTLAVLEELQFEVDASICPRMDFSSEEGPDFSDCDALPFWISDDVLEIPCTVDYTGWLGPLRQSAHRMASLSGLSRLKAVGVLAKSGMANKVMLSPEGNTYEEMRRLASALVGRGCRAMTLSFHSPSVAPGHTPYVRTTADLETFLGDLERFFEFFTSELDGIPASPLDFRASCIHGVFDR